VFNIYNFLVYICLTVTKKDMEEFYIIYERKTTFLYREIKEEESREKKKEKKRLIREK